MTRKEGFVGREAALVGLAAVEGDGAAGATEADGHDFGGDVVSVEVFADLGDVAGDGLAEDKACGAAGGGDAGGGAQGEEADVAAAVDDEIRVEVEVELVGVVDAELAGAEEVAFELGEADGGFAGAAVAAIADGEFAILDVRLEEGEGEAAKPGAGEGGRDEEQLVAAERGADSQDAADVGEDHRRGTPGRLDSR